MTKVLFVCLGNICRSPAAEGVFTKLAERAGIAVTTDSAGTSDWHVGNAPYQPMQDAAANRGYDLSDLRARQFIAADYTEFDLIIGMDDANIADMETLRPPGNATPVRLFLDYVPAIGERAIPDPYYTRDYQQALDLIEAAAAGLTADLTP